MIKRWRDRTPEIVQNVKNLTTNAELCAEAWLEGNASDTQHEIEKNRIQAC